MEGGLPCVQAALDRQALAALMPMYVLLDAAARIRDCGPTLEKLIGGDAAGRPFEAVFVLRRPGRAREAGDLIRSPRLRLHLRAPPGTLFKGVAVPLALGGGALVNLSFGHAVRDAVQHHRLSDTDFAPTDLAIELLYLAEAKAVVMAELEDMNRRLHGAKRQAEEQALTDPLTGLRNRRGMEGELGRLLSGEGDFALVHLDLDHFKAVNDSLGHAAGDHVLCRVAAVLARSVRDGDLVARVGGDEFVLLLKGMGEAGAVAGLGARILAQLREPLDFRGRPCHVGASLGAVMARSYRRRTADAMLGDADRALYAAKRAGRGCLAVIDRGRTMLTRIDQGGAALPQG